MSQKIRIDEDKTVSVDEVFRIIKSQTKDYMFIYQSDLFKDLPKVELKKGIIRMDRLISQSLSTGNLSVVVTRNNTILVKEKSKGEQSRISGLVTDETGQSLPGVTIFVKGTTLGTATDFDGKYSITVPNPENVLVFSSLGLETQEITVGTRTIIDVVMKEGVNELDEVTLVSTGYQETTKERSTGSVDKVDNVLVNRRVSTNILDRLEGVASGVRFQTNIPEGSTESPISIRGRSTIFSNTSPLIVVDDFPYEGDITNINPNDVESITILKDAAAASIWGARASNGVIVITTKKGNLNQPLQVNFNTNVTIGSKPDLYYDKNYIPSADFIGFEKYLFDQGFYDGDLNDNSYPAINPVVELLDQNRNGDLSDADLNVQLNAYGQVDRRKDMEKYLYRSSINRQYSMSFSGGSDKATYLFSVGYDKNDENLIRNDRERLTINTANTFRPFDKLEASVGFTYTQNTVNSNNRGQGYFTSSSTTLPYLSLADRNGNPIDIPFKYRYSYITNVGDGQLLPWTYSPLQELELADNKTRNYHFRINPKVKYTLFNGLSAQLNYQYEKGTGKARNLENENSFSTRDIINRFSQVNTDGTITRPIPTGAILYQVFTELTSRNLRGQLDFNRTFGGKHNVIALAGAESRKVTTSSVSSTLYGYDEENGSGSPNLDYTQYYPFYGGLGGSGGTIPLYNTESGTEDVFYSYYGNLAYTFDNRITLYSSGRMDQSNLFGVETNQKTNPFWSVGGAWVLSRETFFNPKTLSFLKLRASYGYNGNINKSVSALTTTWQGSYLNSYGLTEGGILNPPNPNLKWEEVGVWNAGLDFRLFSDVVSGSIEYYQKKGRNLFGNIPTPPSGGVTQYLGNVANIKGHGWDVTFNSTNIHKDSFSWTTNLMLSIAKDEVTSFDDVFPASSIVAAADGYTSTGSIVPVVGRPVLGVYSYDWAGLDSNSGDPQGYVEGIISTDYPTILNSTLTEDLIYHGSARPTSFGGLRNTLSYKQLSLSFNVTYKLGYYFRTNTINYFNFFNSNEVHQDILNRWMQPGDEVYTNVPSLVYPANSQRDNFYQYASVNVHKGDHVRLQDIQLSFDLGNQLLSGASLKQIQLYLYANNLGLLWKANNIGIDPDYVTGYPAASTLALGVKANF